MKNFDNSFLTDKIKYVAGTDEVGRGSLAGPVVAAAVFFDEDVPGGATAYMMQKVLEDQGGFRYLDAEPKTMTSNDHRPAYSTEAVSRTLS